MAGALRIYKTLWDLLAEDYDMEPSAATQTLVAEIKGAPSLPPSRVVPVFPPSLADTSLTLAISVLPSTMHQIDPEKLHLVTGFRQHLIASMVRFREWQVTDVPCTMPWESGPPLCGQWSSMAKTWPSAVRNTAIFP